MIVRPSIRQEGLLLDSAALTDRMATDLREAGIATEREAIRLLTEKGYRFGDVAALAEDALTAATARRGQVVGRQ